MEILSVLNSSLVDKKIMNIYTTFTNDKQHVQTLLTQIDLI